MGRGKGRTSGEGKRKDKWGGEEEGQVGRRKATSPSKHELTRAQHRQFALEIDSRCDACGGEGLPVKDPPAVAVL